MRAIAVVAVVGCVLLLCARPLAAAEPTVACGLLTPAQIGAATGATIGAGSPIAKPTSCQWMGQGKTVTLTINQARAGKSPVDQFNEGKANKLAGAITVESVGGVGDDAYYVYFAGTTRAGCGLVVKKGSSVFEIRVYGFELSQAKTVSKTLAQNAASKF
jgi:hypothetical protein